VELLTFRLDNVLLAKRYLLIRPVKLTEQSLSALKTNGLDESTLKKLEVILDQEFSSESEFLTSIKDLTPGQEDLVLSYAERGTPNRILRSFSKTNPESSSSVLSTLNLIQRFNLLYIDENREFEGPTILSSEAETLPGDPQLPLLIEWSLTPSPNFSVGLFFRYDYQVEHIVESRASISASVSDKNKASIGFSKNEKAYRTPEGGFHGATNTLLFSDTFQINDNLDAGFSGTVNLAESSVQGRRLLQNSLFMNYNCPKCYNINLQFSEQVSLITEDDGTTTEVINPTIFVTVTLGEVFTFNPQKVQLNEVTGTP